VTFHYLATPYSRYPGGLPAAFEAAAEQAAILFREGVSVFCPIAHSHPLKSYPDAAENTHEAWMKFDSVFMRAAKGLIVCMLEGWEQSIGVRQEIEFFESQGKPVVYMVPGAVPSVLLRPQRRILGFCGYATAGKDTAALGLIAAGWTRVAFADAVRNALTAINPIVQYVGADTVHIDRLANLLRFRPYAELKPFIREELQRLGTEAGRQIHGEDCWVRIAERKIDAIPGNVVLTDVRFPNEAAAIRSWGGKIVRIDRPGCGPLNDHASEKIAFEPDAVVVNDGTIEQLHERLLQCFLWE